MSWTVLQATRATNSSAEPAPVQVSITQSDEMHLSGECMHLLHKITFLSPMEKGSMKTHLLFLCSLQVVMAQKMQVHCGQQVVQVWISHLDDLSDVLVVFVLNVLYVLKC